MATLPAPQNQTRHVVAEASFQFHCHAGLSCFTECCRELDLALSPYDVIRLKQALALNSPDFLERYAIIEFGTDDLYPKVYLAMIDDGRASCPFVGTTGCLVYQDRPGACRTYPVGRGASLDRDGHHSEHFVMINEEHCRGFEEGREQSIRQWQIDQQISDYNQFNDLLLPLLIPRDNAQRPQRLSPEEATLFIDTLYNLELFKSRLPQATVLALPSSAESDLLCYAVDWLQQQWYLTR